MQYPLTTMLFLAAALVACAGASKPTTEATKTEAATGVQPAVCGTLDGPDEDGDGLTDAREASLGSDPKVADSDADGKSDGKEVCQMKTDPTKRDTDGDGLADGAEVARGLDPLVADPGVAPPKPAPQVGGAGPDGVPVAEGAENGGVGPDGAPTAAQAAPPPGEVAPSQAAEPPPAPPATEPPPAPAALPAQP
jgi:hypothetical protein